MSSLEKQLKRLRIPDSRSLERATKFKKKTSFLFDAKEASDIDNETVFALALNGLDELKVLNSQFEQFETLLFGESTKYIERSLQSQEVNDNLDNNIKDYLRYLSPYILLKPAHKTLEWLIRRYHVHLYNIDDLLACVSPYHQSVVFARVVQLLNLTNTKWSWLTSVQKTGSPLPQSTIIQHCISNPAFFTFLSGLVFNIGKTKTNTENSSSVHHVFASFYASTVIGVLDRLHKVSEEILTALIAQIVHGLRSGTADLQAASYMIIGQLTRKCVLETSVINSLLKVMCKNADIQLSEHLVMCINCVCSSSKVTEFPKVVYRTLCNLPNLETLLSELSIKHQMDSFLKLLIFYLIKKSMGEEVDEETKLLNLLRDVDVTEITRMEIIRHVLNEYIMKRAIIDETDLCKLKSSVNCMVRIFQNRWQQEMDKTVQEYLVSLRNEEISEEEKKRYIKWTQDFVSLALSNVGSQVVCDTGSTLVIALHHPEAEYRKLALKKISDILNEPIGDSDDNQFLKESLVLKLNDEDPSVVSAVLELSEGLINVCGGKLLLPHLLKLMEKSSEQWNEVFEKSLDILLSSKMFEQISCTKETILFCVLPFVFLKKKSIDRAKLVIDQLGKSPLKSHWLVKGILKKKIREGLEKCVENSNFEELAVENARIVSAIAEGMNCLENQSALETIKVMQTQADKSRNQIFEIMYFMICCQFVNNCKHDDQRFEAISLFLPGLLALVCSVFENKEKSKITKDLDSADFETEYDGCGVTPVRLLSNYLHMLKRKKERNLLYVRSKIYIYIFEHVIKCLPQTKQHSSSWWSSDAENNTMILLAVFDVVFQGLAKGKEFALHDELKSCFETLVRTEFPHRLQFLKLLTWLWSSAARHKSSGNQDMSVPSGVMVIQSLHVAKILIQSLNEKEISEITSDESQVFPSLLVCLTSPITAVRRTALDLIFLVVSRSADKSSVAILGNIVSESSQEIIADETFISSVFQRSILHPSKPLKGGERRKSKSRKHSAGDNVLIYLLNHIVHEDTPSYVARALLTTLNKVDSEDFLITGHNFMKQMVENVVKTKDYCSFDESQILLYFIQKFTARTSGLLKTEPKICEMFLQLLTVSKPLYNGHKTPQQAAIYQITAEYFESIDDELIQNRVLGKLIDVLIITKDPKISTMIKNVLKQIPISADQILSELSKDDKPKARKTKKSQPEISQDWSSSLGPFWQRVIVIVEVLQAKDNINESETLLPSLFKLLSMCLEMSSQTTVDYVKQVLLSTMLKICHAHVDQSKGVLSEEHFSVEQIIRCIRVSENPQTHHHALSLLAIAASLFPDKVLHNVMSIFTFMGMSVLRQDDAYSFQVIKKTVESVIPALIKAEKNERNMKGLVTKVLRVFVDAYPHVPEHRRLPVFVHLLTTLGPSSYLHVCLALLLEKLSSKDAKVDTKESGLIFCSFLCREFSPDTQFSSLVSLLKYLEALPEEKPEGNNRKRYADSSDIVFDVNTHSGKELHHFKLYGIEVILSVLGNENLTEQLDSITDEEHCSKNHYLSLLEESLKYIAFISRSLESNIPEMTIKYLRVLLHKVYHIVEKVCDLLPRPSFVTIVSELVRNENAIIRKKSMDLFNKRMSKNPRPCSIEEMEMSLSLIDALVLLLQDEEEPPVNKQSAFNTIVMISKLLDDNHNLALKKVFSVAIEIISGVDGKAQVISSALHCLAELCSVLKVHSIPFLPKFLPLVLEILENKNSEKRSDMVLLSALVILQKVIQTLSNFVSPYLKNILVQLVSSVFVNDTEETENKQILGVAKRLRTEIAVLVKPRILIPNISQCYEEIVLNKNTESLIALYQILGSCITHMTKDDVKYYHNELLPLFMSALDYRSQYGQDISEDHLIKIEETIIGAFISLIMRLSESLFRPMFLKLVDWATRSSAAKSRQLVFYHLADKMADKLKGLFVLFAGYLIKNTASILDANNVTKKEESFFAAEYDNDAAIEKSCQLLNYALDCLYKCFLYDNQRFVNKERFDRLLQPLVNQIENQMGEEEVFDERISDHLAPCIAQFAVAAGDETYWKAINHQICLKTRHSSYQVRLAGLKVMQRLNQKLGEEYLTLLPEIIPFLAELMEDESFEVEQKCQQVISEMEEILGESLQKYF